MALDISKLGQGWLDCSQALTRDPPKTHDASSKRMKMTSPSTEASSTDAHQAPPDAEKFSSNLFPQLDGLDWLPELLEIFDLILFSRGEQMRPIILVTACAGANTSGRIVKANCLVVLPGICQTCRHPI